MRNATRLSRGFDVRRGNTAPRAARPGFDSARSINIMDTFFALSMEMNDGIASS
jgi:hypothetical protein